MDDELHGYKPVYKNAVETVVNADPKVLSAVHELFFSDYGIPDCIGRDAACKANHESMYRFSALVREAIKQKETA